MSNTISIITPSIRPSALKIVAESLSKQTYKDWEWLVCSHEQKRQEVDRMINNIVPYVFIGNKPLQSGQFWDLNYSYNRLFQRALGELLISWQDSIWIPPEGIEKFVVASQIYDGVISGVGDQYERQGKFSKPEVKIWYDPRKTDQYGSFYEVFPNDAEFNWCAIPKKDVIAAGGMDEQLDFLGYGGDQLQLCERMNDLGVKFYLDQTNESYTIRHSRDDFGGQVNWDAHHVLFNGAYDKRVAELKKLGKWPCIGYL